MRNLFKWNWFKKKSSTHIHDVKEHSTVQSLTNSSLVNKNTNAGNYSEGNMIDSNSANRDFIQNNTY
ncbi:MAG: hypothetical protein WAX77_09275 [Methylococcaceae bacterium]